MEEKQIEALILGHAIGDALGVPVEFRGREELLANPVHEMRGFGTHPVPIGAWSDDTSMTLALAESIGRLGHLDLADVMENFRKWMDEAAFTPTGDVFDMGRTCGLSIYNFKQGFSPVECGGRGEGDNGNGCGIYVLIAVRLLDGMGLEDAVKGGLEEAHDRYLAKDRFRKEVETYHRIWDVAAFRALSLDCIRSSGYVVDTLEAVIYCLLTTKSYADCVLKSVNLGEDTDTIGAIAGGLAGIAYGLDAIPKEWQDALLKRDEIQKLCASFAGALCSAEKHWKTVELTINGFTDPARQGLSGDV